MSIIKKRGRLRYPKKLCRVAQVDMRLIDGRYSGSTEGLSLPVCISGKRQRTTTISSYVAEGKVMR